MHIDPPVVTVNHVLGDNHVNIYTINNSNETLCRVQLFKMDFGKCLKAIIVYTNMIVCENGVACYADIFSIMFSKYDW